MFPLTGFSMTVHFLVLLVRFFSWLLGVSGRKIKAGILRLGLKISPRFCLAVFRRDAFWWQFFAYLIIISVFSTVIIINFLLMKTSLRSGSNLASLEEIFDSQLVLANQKNDQEIVWTDKNQLTSDQIQEQASWLIAQYRVIDIYQINNYHEQSGSGSTKHIRLLLDKE